MRFSRPPSVIFYGFFLQIEDIDFSMFDFVYELRDRVTNLKLFLNPKWFFERHGIVRFFSNFSDFFQQLREGQADIVDDWKNDDPHKVNKTAFCLEFPQERNIIEFLEGREKMTLQLSFAIHFFFCKTFFFLRSFTVPLFCQIKPDSKRIKWKSAAIFRDYEDREKLCSRQNIGGDFAIHS